MTYVHFHRAITLFPHTIIQNPNKNQRNALSKARNRWRVNLVVNMDEPIPIPNLNPTMKIDREVASERHSLEDTSRQSSETTTEKLCE